MYREKSCIQMIWAYDRGALTYKFPSDTGIRLGPSVGFTHLLLQIHYLLPKGYVVGQGDGFFHSVRYRGPFLSVSLARKGYRIKLSGVSPG